MESSGTKMVSKSFHYIIFLVAFSAVYGCGVIPAGQGRSRNFALTGFKLPAAMAYSTDITAISLAPNISTSSQNAITLVQNLIMRAVEEVLYQQGRSAGLPDSVISSILQQLNVNVSYNPLKCDKVITNPMVASGKMMMVNCVIRDDIVTTTCNPPNDNECDLPAHADNHKSIDPPHLTISGTFTTSNIVMANWSNQMWQSVLNRVLRSLTAGSLGSNFYGASVTI